MSVDACQISSHGNGVEKGCQLNPIAMELPGIIIPTPKHSKVGIYLYIFSSWVVCLQPTLKRSLYNKTAAFADCCCLIFFMASITSY